jgi:polyphosphate kinase
MPDVKKQPSPVDLNSSEYYFNRELSWLEFNYRVLHEAFDDRTLLIERLKFLAIFSSNLDEFFMIRVAILKDQIVAPEVKLAPDRLSPQDQMTAIVKRLRPLVTKQHQHFEQELRPMLKTVGVHLLNYIDLNKEQRNYLQTFFQKRIFPVLTPLGVDPGRPFPLMSNLSLNLAVALKSPRTGQNSRSAAAFYCLTARATSATASDRLDGRAARTNCGAQSFIAVSRHGHYRIQPVSRYP